MQELDLLITNSDPLEDMAKLRVECDALKKEILNMMVILQEMILS